MATAKKPWWQRVSAEQDAKSKKMLNPFAKAPPVNDDNNQQQNLPPNNQQNNQQDNGNPRASMETFFAGSGIDEGIDAGAFIKAVNDGDGNAAFGMMQQMMRNAATVALKGADRIANHKLTRAEATARELAEESINNRFLEDEMFNRVPFAKNEAIAPMAREALNGFLNQGKSGPEAIDAVEEYFANVTRDASSHYGFKSTQQSDGRPGSNGFKNSRMQNSNNGNENSRNKQPAETDWLDALTEGHQTFDSVNEALNAQNREDRNRESADNSMQE